MQIIYGMKTMLRAKMLIFWSLAFPIILGFMFYLMFGNIIKDNGIFSEISVGITGKEADGDLFKELLSETETDEGAKMFKVTEYDDMESALDALKKDDIEGIVALDDGFKLTVKKSGIGQSVIRTFIDQYNQNTKLVETILKEHPEKIWEVVSLMNEGINVEIKDIPLKGSDKSPYTQYFYALISMLCLIGTMVGLSNIVNIQADLSPLAARRNIAPTSKIKQVLCDFAGSYIIYCVLVVIVIFVCIFIYGQDFGDNVGLVLLGGFIGSFTGISIGSLIGVLVKGARRKKEAMCTVVFMGSSFLAGLQWGDITYILEKNCPIINRINPATLIVNAFKSLSVFGDYKGYATNMITLVLIGIFCATACILKMRRMKYGSI